MAFVLDFEGSELSKKLKGLGKKASVVLLAYSSTKAKRLEGEMKVNRPWTDNTGDAKKYLHAFVSQPNNHTIRITLSHGVEYGIWLELANGGNYAIVRPTVKKEGPKIVSDLNGIFNSME